VDVRNDLATVLILQGKREDGKREFLRAFGEPTNPTPELSARNLGQAYFEEQNYAEALTWFQTSVKRNTKYPDAHLGLAECLLALNRSEEAVVQLEAASNHVPDDNNILLALGNAYFKVGRFTEARAKLERVAKADPTGAAGRRAAELIANLPR
jgi:tetratricopeptide (TPR) repeat protein